MTAPDLWRLRGSPGARDEFVIKTTAVVLYAAVYLAFDWLRVSHALPGPGLALWNPLPAFGLVLLLAQGLRCAPVPFVVGLLSDWAVGGAPAGIAEPLLANALAAAALTVFAALLRPNLPDDDAFGNLADIARFLAISILVALALAGLAAAAPIVTGALPPAGVLVAVRQVSLGDLAAVLGLVPAIMGIPAARLRWNKIAPSTGLRDIALFSSGLAVSLVVIGTMEAYSEPHFFYLMFLPVVWIAARQGLAWAAIAVLLAQVALVATVARFGSGREDVLAFQIFLLTIAFTGLIIGSAVTERHRAETALRRQQAELARMGRITTAGALGLAVVHQISQPLATIATYTHASRRLLQSGSADRDLVVESMAKAEAEVQRAGLIIERMREFTARGKKSVTAVNLGALAREIAEALGDDARRAGVRLRVDAPPVPSVTADRIQIEQVLVNLVRNAIEAGAALPTGKATVRIMLASRGEEVEVAVEDQGPGIPPEAAASLFEPFETSKANGMGLGLWLSRELVEGNGGRLWYDPGRKGGARFVFRLPRRGQDVL